MISFPFKFSQHFTSLFYHSTLFLLIKLSSHSLTPVPSVIYWNVIETEDNDLDDHSVMNIFPVATQSNRYQKSKLKI